MCMGFVVNFHQSNLELELSSKRNNERYGALGHTQIEGRFI